MTFGHLLPATITALLCLLLICAPPSAASSPSAGIDESWDTFTKAEDQFQRHMWAQAADLYHKGLVLDEKLKITRIDAARHFLKAAREAKNQTYIDEAQANLKKLRSDPDYTLTDPYYGIKKVHLMLKATPGSLWEPNQPGVRIRINKLFEVHDIDLLPQAAVGADSAELQITVKTFAKGGKIFGEVVYEFWRMDPLEKPQSLSGGNQPPRVTTGHALVPQVIARPADAESLLIWQLDGFFDKIDDSRVD